MWIQCFHWKNITTVGKYPCVCVMPEQYFAFSCLSANESISAKKEKGKKKCFLRLCLHSCLRLRQGRIHGEIKIIVLTLVLALVLGQV